MITHQSTLLLSPALPFLSDPPRGFHAPDGKGLKKERGEGGYLLLVGCNKLIFFGTVFQNVKVRNIGFFIIPYSFCSRDDPPSRHKVFKVKPAVFWFKI